MIVKYPRLYTCLIIVILFTVLAMLWDEVYSIVSCARTISNKYNILFINKPLARDCQSFFM